MKKIRSNQDLEKLMRYEEPPVQFIKYAKAYRKEIQKRLNDFVKRTFEQSAMG